jgi:soluble lytic murein transglycosylase-like protein
VDPFRPTSNWGNQNDWSGSRPPAADWSHLATNPLAGGSSLWAGDTRNDSFYAPIKSTNKGSYDPTYGGYATYDPYSKFTSAMIEADLQKWMQSEFPELFDFNTGQLNTGSFGTPGDVARDPGLGAFARYPQSWDAIQKAAQESGVPANVIQAFIHMESSGEWGRDGSRLWWGRPESGGLLPYIGVFDDTLQSRLGITAESLVGNMQGQISAMGQILRQMWDEVKGTNPQYGWGNVASYYFSGEMDPIANPWQDESGNYGGNAGYMQTFNDVLARLDAWTTANGGTPGAMGTTGLASPVSPEWEPVNRWDAYVEAAAAKYGVPANMIKAVIRLESGGDPRAAHSSSGATGLMQIMPGIWNGGNQQQLFDPAYNIDLGTKILRQNYDQYGTWDMAAQAYLGFGTDANGTTNTMYSNRIMQYWDELNAQITGAFGQEGGVRLPTDPGPVTNVSAIWGNQDFPISQEHGRTEFAAADPLGFYDYSIGLLGYRGHPGIDVSMPRGTAIYTPVGGTVIVSGNGAYRDAYGGPGEVRIQLDNGHEIIFGHLAGAYVQVGDRVNAGQLIASSGNLNGDHLHLEYRVPDPKMGSGWAAVDPREALRGVFTGSLTSPTATPGINRPMTYDEILMAAAQGKPVDYGQPLSSGSSWNLWMQRAMSGLVPNKRNDTASWAGREQGASGAPALPGFGSFTNPLVQQAVR